ncbi:hypothetical protein D187_005605 [Cystobacter fuscus DSM 2262]|uniref:Uncharacterized protein n=1 Tax=Cystobacter fuscus (strain ATCC 25194 / DSM 2262 / NBRC 100088 / M29) TaxID=1242864 RepID=S9P5R0_CYSF2|nr:hypothetical protein D187_005605 [Cystobacter fuscus DSM 2262]
MVGGLPGDWSGGFWKRCYSAEPVLDDTALGRGGCVCPGD